jgi:membrane protein
MVAVGVAFYSFLAIFPALAALQWKWLSWGAVVATLIWLAGSSLFSFYVANLGNYNKTYGSIGVVVILMTWFLLGHIAFAWSRDQCRNGTSDGKGHDHR